MVVLKSIGPNSENLGAERSDGGVLIDIAGDGDIKECRHWFELRTGNGVVKKRCQGINDGGIMTTRRAFTGGITLMVTVLVSPGLRVS